jgi:trigger factor
VKSAVETLNPTRVRLTVEVPFEELKPSLDAAYRRIAAQVTVPGFRKGKVPPRIIDQRFGRAVVLEEAVNEALPQFYGQAVEQNSVKVLGQPEVDVTEFNDGEELKFTAEVDVQPEVVLPEYEGLEVTVDDVALTDEEVEQQVQSLRDRFAVLASAQRPAQEGDFVTLDLVASKGGAEIDDAKATGVSYEVGSGSMLDGLDDAVTGLSAGESTTFATKLLGGEHAGQDVEVAVTVSAVKEKQLPELDDDFAQTASEFDTLDELRADTRARTERMKKLELGSKARDKVLEAVLEKVDVPLPEGVVAAEIDHRKHSLQHQLEQAGLTREAYLSAEGQSEEEFDADIEKRAREAIKAQFVLDAVAQKEQLSVAEGELSQHIMRRAMSVGLSPEQFAQEVVQSGQVGQLVSEVVRGKALALLVEAATIRDASGNEVDLSELLEAGAGETVEAAEEPLDEDADEVKPEPAAAE